MDVAIPSRADLANAIPSGADLAAKAWAAIGDVRDPEIGMRLEELGMLRSVEVERDVIKAHIALTVPGCPMKERIAADVAAALRPLDGISGVEVTFDSMDEAQRGAVAARVLDSTRIPAPVAPTVLAVASGKGGVGKSTVAVNLACAMADAGLAVGLLDTDVWGFSVPHLLGVHSRPVGFDGLLFPVQAYGLKLMSVGLFADGRAPVVWRGPLLHKTMRQFVAEVQWGELDVLVCDLPPGTGDVPISLAALLPGARFVVVTTPQEAAAAVAERAGHMAEHAELEIAGVIENMASFSCPCCGEQVDIFGSGGGQTLADTLGVPLLARVPLMAELRAAGDRGAPIVLSDPECQASLALRAAARALTNGVE